MDQYGRSIRIPREVLMQTPEPDDEPVYPIAWYEYDLWKEVERNKRERENTRQAGGGHAPGAGGLQDAGDGAE